MRRTSLEWEMSSRKHHGGMEIFSVSFYGDFRLDEKRGPTISKAPREGMVHELHPWCVGLEFPGSVFLFIFLGNPSTHEVPSTAENPWILSIRAILP